MPGKPYKTSFPEEAFTVKDGISLNNERECLNSASGTQTHSHSIVAGGLPLMS